MSDAFTQRTFDFALRIVRMFQALPEKDAVAQVLGKQVLRSGTSVGANSRAAKRAKSRADFIAKMGIVEEECDETIYWTELLVAAGTLSQVKVEPLLKEGDEILAITVASIRTARANDPKKK